MNGVKLRGVWRAVFVLAAFAFVVLGFSGGEKGRMSLLFVMVTCLFLLEGTE